MYYVYIIYSLKVDLFYKGITQHVGRRLSAHNNNESPFTRNKGPWELVAVFEKPNRSSAMQLERKLKNLTRVRLQKFLEKYADGRGS